MAPTPSLSAHGKQELTRILEDAASRLSGVAFTVASAAQDTLLFEGYAGSVDVLDPASRPLTNDTFMFFASTTKLLTSIAILQLVDQGVTSLDSDVSKFLPQLSTPLQIFESVNEAGEAVYRETNTPITVQQMLNQTSGFGQEFGERVVSWKKTLKPRQPGAGFVNSCKIDNLIHTPIIEEPGTVYAYGNSAEWLGLFVQNATGKSLEEYMQENIFKPLGMSNTSFLPFGGEKAERLMPLRWYEDSTGKFEVLKDQFPGLTLPRKIEDIEYVVGGGGVFSNPTDYVKVLRHLLVHYDDPSNSSKILSDSSIASLFKGTLPESAKPGLTAMIGEAFEATKVGELDWTTGLLLYGKEGQRGGWGRNQGSVGWFGAANTMSLADPKAGIAAVFSAQYLPHGHKEANEVMKQLEKALYAGLE